jgi:hypothetical protein
VSPPTDDTNKSPPTDNTNKSPPTAKPKMRQSFYLIVTDKAVVFSILKAASLKVGALKPGRALLLKP